MGNHRLPESGSKLLLYLLACRSETPPLLVLAPSSLTDVLPRVAEAWGQPVELTFDASSRLARQLESGVTAEVFLSADEQWMDWAAERALVLPETRRNLLGNTLVTVVPSGSSFVPRSVSDLASPEIVHLALAGENVPAGRYARAALAELGGWEAVSAKVVNGDTVRTALEWVARGESQAGIVYATDAKVDPNVQLASSFPPDSHPPIIYPGAVVASSRYPEASLSFLDFCQGEGRSLFEEAGFVVLPRSK
jgi:molybdate transport system substrate-binding protein